ncbi:hypothetical protein HYX19_02140 [Candidatus Woesearchaeota archaeon]|nr:hypothetical protein [Candidatus Woesearchaeota archaeon]
MKKTLIGLGLASILSLSSNLSALEVNEKGFPVPDKTNAKIVNSEINTYKDGVVEALYYHNTEEDSSAFIEVYGNDDIWLYQIYPDRNDNRFYIIEDRNCDKIFETKYGINEPKQVIRLPDCYKKNPNEK